MSSRIHSQTQTFKKNLMSYLLTKPTTNLVQPTTNLFNIDDIHIKFVYKWTHFRQ
jgi:hypothetical protein